MAIVKMKRLRLIALEEEKKTLFGRLQSIGCVEVCESEGKLTDPAWSALLHRDTAPIGELKAQISQVTHALNALRRYAPVKSGPFEKRPCLSEQEFLDSDAFHSSLSIVKAINESLVKITRLQSQENHLITVQAGLRPWSTLQYSLNNMSTEHVSISLGVCPASVLLSDLTQQLAEEAPLTSLVPVHRDRDQHYLLLLCHKTETNTADKLLKNYSYSTVQFKELTGTAAENIARLDQELAELVRAREAEEQHIATYTESRPALKHCFDRLQQDLSREGAREHLLTNGTILFMEGWVSADKLDTLIHTLDSFSCAYDFSDPEKDDRIPTLLKNPKWMTPINMVTEMYSLPAYRGIDPNPFIFWFFIFYFGFMFADIAYGIIIFTISSIIVNKYHPKNTMGYLFNLARYLGISTCICGFATGSFFGDVITVFSKEFLGMENVTLPYLINPLEDPMKVLIIAISIGIFQLLFGQCIHIYMGFRDGEPLEGILDVVPWWIVFAGIIVAVLTGSFLVLLLGALSLIATQGRSKKGFFGKLFGGIASLYDITSWLGDVLSYSRLMALMLATSVIASVMNILGTLAGNVFVFFIVFIIGHTFNIGVNLIGTYVHGARLQYLEFFGKFYVEGGIPFKPLRYNTKYVDVIPEKEAE